MTYTFLSYNVEETKSFAKRLVRELKVGDIVLLTGDLGAGKTTLVSGALEELGYKDHVISPTFNILKCYFDVTPPVYHIDAYRLEGQNIDIGLEEYIEGDGICFIEWPNFISSIIPEKHLTIAIKRVDDTTRKIVIEDYTDSFNEVINKVMKENK